MCSDADDADDAAAALWPTGAGDTPVSSHAAADLLHTLLFLFLASLPALLAAACLLLPLPAAWPPRGALQGGAMHSAAAPSARAQARAQAPPFPAGSGWLRARRLTSELQVPMHVCSSTPQHPPS